jgi:PAS domain S-box-containing protein
MDLFFENKNIKVLAIDDNPDNHISLKAILMDAFKDVQIFSAMDGQSGIEMARKHGPDVILLDVIMPGMDGFEVCKHLKEDEYLTEIPVIFLTALRGDKESRIRGLEAGAEAFLSKPIDESELIAQIRAMVKIKSINSLKRDENERLAALVYERTQQLESTHIATLNLLEDLQKENDARKQTEEALVASEALYKAILYASPDNIVITDLSGIVIMSSPSAIRTFGVDENDFLNNKIYIGDFVVETDRERMMRDLHLMIKGQQSGPNEYKCKDKKGNVLDVEVKGGYINDKDGNLSKLVFLARDITERNIVNGKIRHISRLYAFLGQINQAVVRINNQVDLLKKICEVAVEYGGFKMAWVGLYDENKQTVSKVAQSGYDDGYLDLLVPSLSEHEIKDGPTLAAIESGKLNFSNDIKNELRMKLWRSEALARGYKSMVAIPLLKSNSVIGVLNIYADEVGFFNNEDEQKLINEIWEDISFALTNIELNEIRVRIEQNLIESENRYNTFINNNVDLIFVKDEELRYLVVNDALSAFFNKPKNEIIGKTDYELADMSMISPCPESDKRALSCDGVNVFYEELGEKIFETTKFRMKLRDGKYGVGGILHDITNRRKSEIALEESRLELKAIYDNAPVMLCVVNEEFQILYQNNEFESFVNLSDTGISGNVIGNVIKCIQSAENEKGCGHGSKCSECKLRQALKQTLEDHESQKNIEYHTTVMVGDQLKEVDLLGSAALIETSGQKKLLICLFDISERRNAEKALQKSEMILRTFIDNAPFGIWARDVNGVGILENHLLAENLGSIFGKTLYNDEQLSERRVKELEEINRKVFNGEIVETELRHRVADGLKIYQNIAFPIYLEDNVMGIAGFDIDVTEKKKTENALKESQQQLKNYAAHLQKVREEERNLLAREIHDDLGQILVGLKIDIGLLKMKLPDYMNAGANVLTDELVKISDLVNNTIKTTRRIISDLRPEALEELGLVDALKHHIKAFEERYKIQTEFITEIDAVNIGGEPATAIFRIMQESLNNVAKHSKASYVEIKFGKQAEKLYLEISDDGVGFDVSKKSRIDSYGLIGMKERARVLDAELKIWSEPDKGTKIRIELPVQEDKTEI